jgi:hypothetical protein
VPGSLFFGSRGEGTVTLSDGLVIWSGYRDESSPESVTACGPFRIHVSPIPPEVIMLAMNDESNTSLPY